jgi:hypothetical protein
MSKMKVLAIGLVCIGASLAIAALASAELLHNGKKLKENAQIETTGKFNLAGATSGVDCNKVHTTIDLDATTEDLKATTYKVTEPTKNCTVTGELATTGCQVESVTATGLPWTGVVVPETERVVWVDVTIDYTLTCSKVLAVEGEMTSTPDQAEAIHTLFPSGTMASNLGEVEVSGELAVTPSGTYGIK